MSTIKEDEIFKLWRIRVTAMQMLNDRGYLVSSKEFDITEEEFKKRYLGSDRNDLSIVANHQEDSSNIIYVFFSEEEKLSVNHIRTYIECMKKDNTLRAIIIIKNAITPSARQVLEDMAKENYMIEVFHESELIVNVTKHVLVPQHYVLSNEEKKEVLDRYLVKESQMPRIQQKDPIARYFGVKKGQMFKIVRKSETAGRYITYRIVY